MAINELRSISIFVKTAELGSLRKAAMAQGLSPQAASQALAQLEHHLGVRLFHRTTRSMALTEEGRQFLDTVQPALQGLNRALHTAKRTREEIAGPLRIAGPHSTFRPVITSLVSEFCQRYPEVQPDVQLDDRIGNWVEDQVDVGFRIGASPKEGVIARRLLPLQLIICASPAYLDRHGTPIDLHELSSHRCSVFRHPTTGRVVPWHIKLGDNIVDQHVVPAFCTNDEQLELQTALAGHVIAQVSGITAAAYIRSGQLVPLLLDHVVNHVSLWIYYGSRDSQPARARAFIDLAIEKLSDYNEYVLSTEELISLTQRAHQRTKQ
ncbi:LysR substrate-binding domain-containing protein [Aquirhabdus sp.]|uniref:LysR family transcriptional regulator n=1 Tax=Aquirhabdus sp. TaxID=2824160 RepID=UPI00396CDA9D